MKGKQVDYVFLGSCTNGRMEDFRAFAQFVKGKKKAPNVNAWLVPGSKRVETQIREEGLIEILEEAGFEFAEMGAQIGDDPRGAVHRAVHHLGQVHGGLFFVT